MINILVIIKKFQIKTCLMLTKTYKHNQKRQFCSFNLKGIIFVHHLFTWSVRYLEIFLSLYPRLASASWILSIANMSWFSRPASSSMLLPPRSKAKASLSRWSFPTRSNSMVGVYPTQSMTVSKPLQPQELFDQKNGVFPPIRIKQNRCLPSYRRGVMVLSSLIRACKHGYIRPCHVVQVLGNAVESFAKKRAAPSPIISVLDEHHFFSSIIYFVHL